LFRKLILSAATLISPIMLAETYSYPIEGVESIGVSSGVEFRIQCGARATLDISASSEDDFQMTLKDKKLKITRNNIGRLLSWRFSDVTADITLTHAPQSVDVSAGSHGEMDDCFKNVGKLRLSVSAGSTLKFNGDSGSIGNLDVNISAGSDVEIRNALNLDHLEVTASSGSRFEAGEDIVVETSEVRVSSGASIEVCGARSITGNASSGGSIDVADTTKIVNLRSSSGGNINPDC
jgi:hypothetical protein